MLVFNKTRNLSDILHHMPMGKDRRCEILSYMRQKTEDAVRIPVNRHYCRTLDKDTDLRQLMKKGQLKSVREGVSRTHRTTYLVLAS